MTNIDDSPYPQDPIRIKKFDRKVEIMRSKEKPKKISIYCSNEHIRYFLLKEEKEGDVRKESRSVDIIYLLDRILKSND